MNTTNKLIGVTTMKQQKAKSSQAQCAATIKSELSAIFPNTKFSVSSESFSGGDAVRIRWNNGQTTEQVRAITNKYEYGHFDGMQDMYINNNRRDDIPQVKFISESRTIEFCDKITCIALMINEKYMYADYRELTRSILFSDKDNAEILKNTKYPSRFDDLTIKSGNERFTSNLYDVAMKIAYYVDLSDGSQLELPERSIFSFHY